MYTTLLQPLVFPFILASAHIDPRDNGCCGDIPDSLIWTLSFFVLIGILIVVGAYFTYPSPTSPPPADFTPDTCATAQITYVRIDPRDIRNIARAVNSLKNDT